MLKEAWFLGDRFLKDLFYSFHAMKKPGMDTEPYLHRYYDVSAVHCLDNFPRDKAMGQMINALAEKLDTHRYLPRMIVIMIDHEFLLMMDYFDYGISLMIVRCLTWIISQVLRLVDKKREYLHRKRRGAVVDGEPILVWMKMLHFPSNSKIELIKSKFNVILDQVIVQENAGYVCSPVNRDEYTEPRWFDVNGNLIHTGRVSFWQNVDRKIRDLDYNCKTKHEERHQSHRGDVSFPQRMMHDNNPHKFGDRH